MSKVLIIAEAGVNHNGDLSLAEDLISVAAKAGANFIKFQTFKADKLASPKAQKAKYQMENDKESGSQLEMLKKLELSYEDHFHLKKFCLSKKINFLSAPFDIDSAIFLNELLDIFKIPSGELTNYPLLKVVCGFKKPIILSTGMSTLEEVRGAVEVIKSEWKKHGIEFNKKVDIHGAEVSNLSLLHCTTSYPTLFEDVNLLAMKTLKKELDVSVGYSDHTCGVEVPIAAVAMGASIIEKHFTLDKTLPGPDHLASLDGDELNLMVKSIRNIERSLGSGKKEPRNCEKENLLVARKSLYYSRDITSGTQITEDDIAILRPGNGLSPVHYDQIINKVLKHDVSLSSPIKFSDLVSK